MGHVQDLWPGQTGKFTKGTCKECILDCIVYMDTFTFLWNSCIYVLQQFILCLFIFLCQTMWYFNWLCVQIISFVNESIRPHLTHRNKGNLSYTTCYMLHPCTRWRIWGASKGKKKQFVTLKRVCRPTFQRTLVLTFLGKIEERRARSIVK